MTIKTRLFLLASIFVSIPTLTFARAPQWVNQRPTSTHEWWGVGMAPMNDADHVKTATQNALKEIAQQISSHVQSSSFLYSEEVDYRSREVYQQQVLISTQEYLTGLSIYDTYQDKQNYYICYRLNKLDYEEGIRAKAREIAQQGYAYLSKAQQALSEGNLQSANSQYAKGLEVVEPWLFLDLTYQGVNVPVELYYGYYSVFDGISITLSENTIEASNFQSLNVPIQVQVQRGGVGLPNIPIVASFTTGSGNISGRVLSNSSGQATFYLTQVSGKANIQQIKFSLEKTFLRSIPDIFQNAVRKISLPEAMLTIQVKAQEMKAFLYAKENMLPTCMNQISSILANEHMTAVTDRSAATIFVQISTIYRYQGIVKGDLGDLSEYSATLRVNITDNKDRVLLAYPVEDIRVLVEKSANQSQVQSQCTKELMKRVRRELPNKLKSLHID